MFLSLSNHKCILRRGYITQVLGVKCVPPLPKFLYGSPHPQDPSVTSLETRLPWRDQVRIRF